MWPLLTRTSMRRLCVPYAVLHSCDCCCGRRRLRSRAELISDKHSKQNQLNRAAIIIKMAQPSVGEMKVNHMTCDTLSFQGANKSYACCCCNSTFLIKLYSKFSYWLRNLAYLKMMQDTVLCIIQTPPSGFGDFLL